MTILVLRRVALLIVLAYAAFSPRLFYMQRSLLYPGGGPGRRRRPPPASPTFQTSFSTTPDGERLVGWWRAAAARQGGDPVFPRQRRLALESAKPRRATSRATGRGAPDRELSRLFRLDRQRRPRTGLRTDARAAYDFVGKRTTKRRGSWPTANPSAQAVAVRLATERPVAGLILDAPYTSTVDVAARHLLVRAGGMADAGPVPLDRHHRRRQGAAPRPCTARVTAIIPFAFGERLYDAAPEPKRFLRLEGVGHTRILESGGLAAVDAFIRPIEAAYSEKLPEPDQPKSANRP